MIPQCTDEKIQAIQKAPAPKVVTQLGLINYYSKVLFKLSNTLDKRKQNGIGANENGINSNWKRIANIRLSTCSL